MLDERDIKILGALVENPKGLASSRIYIKARMPKVTVEKHLPDLFQNKLIERKNIPYKNPKKTPQKKLRPYYKIQVYVTKKGIRVFKREQTAEKMKKLTLNFFETLKTEERLTILDNIFNTLFTLTYDEFYQQGNIQLYSKFLQTLENPAKEHLNENITNILEEIKKGNDIGNYEDPYFVIDRIGLAALYHDAKLTKTIGHFLTANHRDVLIKSKEYTEDELIEHNKDWARRFEEEEIEGEGEPNMIQWRLNPVFFVIRERQSREKQLIENQTYGTELKSYYDKLKERTYSRNKFQYDERWPIDIDKTRENIKKRKIKRRSKKSGFDEEILLALERNRGKAIDKWRFYRDGSREVKFYDLKTGELIETIVQKESPTESKSVKSSFKEES